MDRLIYIAMTGAQQTFEQQAVAAHNLSNASTAGYKSETVAFRSAPVQGPGLQTRAYAVAASMGADLTPGSTQTTGRGLDVAVQGDGFIAVQASDGSEAYTRDGSLQTDADGQLQTRGGLAVLGDGGPITIPPDSTVAIGKDGTVSVTTNGQPINNVQIVGQIKLVNPGKTNVAKGADGLFRTKSGGPAEADPTVTLASGAIESSNVNPVSAMVDMINLARQFEMHMKMLQSVDGNSQRATQLLSANGS
jgi:flagellar basal-body rod protein FlgF